MKDEKGAVTISDLYFSEPRMKEAARRIIELSGELRLNISELLTVVEYVKHYAGLALLD